MRLLGAEVRGVNSGSRTLKDAHQRSHARLGHKLRTTHYLLGSVLDASLPDHGARLSQVTGREARKQILRLKASSKAIIACVGGGSNSIGIFYDFIKDKKVQLIGVEAGGRSRRLGDHAARFQGGRRACCRALTHMCCRTSRTDFSDALYFSRPGLSFDWPGTRLAEGHGPRAIRFGK
jgi:tryptophan synthase beta chain